MMPSIHYYLWLYEYQKHLCPDRKTERQDYMVFVIARSSVKMDTFSRHRQEGNVLFNDALNTYLIRLYGIEHMVKDHSGSGRGNSLPPLHGLLFLISSKGPP